MATSSISRSNTTLKTYSRRVNGKEANDTGKKRTIAEISSDETVQEPRHPKQYQRTSIQNYFKPLPAPSTTDASTSRPTSYDSREQMINPTTSFRPRSSNAIDYPAGLRKARRRLNARPHLAPIANASDWDEDDQSSRSLRSPNESYKEHVGTVVGTAVCKSPIFAGCPPPEATSLSTRTHSPVLKRAKQLARQRSTQQVLLDLNISAFTECETCKMQYNQTDKGDRSAHIKFHLEYINGRAAWNDDASLVVYAESIHGSKSIRTGKSSFGEHHKICAIDRKASPESRYQGQGALELSYQDMDGVRIEEKDLWSEITNPHNTKDERKLPRFKLFVYYINKEVAAVLLAERIADGVEYDDGAVSTIRRKAYVGIERIWVKTVCRRQGLATKLLDVARETSIHGLVLAKKDIAFSAPTKDGEQFAKRYSRGSIPGASFLVVL